MGQFTYEGIDSKGKQSIGKIEAEDEKEVRKLLRLQGIRPKKIISPSILEFDLNSWLVAKGFAKTVNAKEMAMFTKQLSIMINAGIPILQSLDILQRSVRNLALRSAIKKVAIEVGEGKTIADAMSGQRVFDRLYCNLVKAGESGGILDSILKKLSTHMEKQEKIKSQIKSAMTYPVIVVIVGIAVIWLMMVFVVPMFVGMLKDSGQALPWITQLIIGISKLLATYTPIAIPLAIVGGVVFLNYMKTPIGKASWDRFVMKIPMFGGIVIKGNLSSFSNTLATLLGSGVSLIEALEICIETLDNTFIANDIKEVKRKVMEGKTLTEALGKISYFPELIHQMIRVGEQTGQIDQMLFKVSEVFEDEVDTLIGGMTKMIEPLIIIILGGIIATILVAMYLPMFMSAGVGG